MILSDGKQLCSSDSTPILIAMGTRKDGEGGIDGTTQTGDQQI